VTPKFSEFHYLWLERGASDEVSTFYSLNEINETVTTLENALGTFETKAHTAIQLIKVNIAVENSFQSVYKSLLKQLMNQFHIKFTGSYRFISREIRENASNKRKARKSIGSQFERHGGIRDVLKCRLHLVSNLRHASTCNLWTQIKYHNNY